MREFVKIRTVAGSLVVSLPQSILEPVGLKEGDRVILEAAPPRRLIITKEGTTMTSVQHLEMEIDLLEKKKIAMTSDLRFKEYQYKHDMPCDEGMSDSAVAVLVMEGLARDRDKLDVGIAEKRIQLYEIQAGDAAQPTTSEPNTGAVVVNESSQIKMSHVAEGFARAPKATRGWFLWRDTKGLDHILAFANAKGSSSMRPFDALTGNAFKQDRNRKGDFQEAFSSYLANARPLHLSKQPSLERQCKSSLPAWVMAELQPQIKALLAASERVQP